MKIRLQACSRNYFMQVFSLKIAVRMAVAGIAKITTAMMAVMMTATVAVMVMHHVLMVQQGIIGGRVEKLLAGISSTAVIFK